MSLTKSEARTIGTDIMSEILPKVKSSERNEFLSEFLNELIANGVELDDDEGDEDFEEEDD